MELSGRRGSAGWRVIVALFGLVLMLVAYFAVHKPLDPVLIGSLGGGLLDLLTASLIAIVAGGLGRRIFSIIARFTTKTADSITDNENLSRPEKVALEGLLGLGILGLIALILGLVGLYRGLFCGSRC